MLTDNSKFNKKNNNSTHTLSFMNVAVSNNVPIRHGAEVINKKLDNFLLFNSAPNTWFALDFPSPDVISRIYKANYRDVSPNSNNGAISLDKIYHSVDYSVDTISRILNLFPNILNKRDNVNNKIDENSIICLQRKIVIDEQGNYQDLVKTDYKCVDNNLNKWRIKQNDNGEYYSIISI
ncbi:hypothetical protein PIROE2DRAFT_67916 [Piromyces sp. E2]|nr:hypothetical protein PIROE2DRAFT_67916 [Piromyces sp. E2]|eukprot:OUM56252.1 hypothetical protein PIROE2DRAFT_67916 [Piromyces sp. E2]